MSLKIVLIQNFWGVSRCATVGKDLNSRYTRFELNIFPEKHWPKISPFDLQLKHLFLELNYDALKNISKSLVESTQTGELGSTLNLTIDVISVSEPAKDPELVVFNINETGINIFML